MQKSWSTNVSSIKALRVHYKWRYNNHFTLHSCNMEFFSCLSPNIRNVVFKMMDPLKYHQEFEDWTGDEPTFKKILEVRSTWKWLIWFLFLLYIHDARSEGAPYEKIPKNKWEKIMQWSHQKRVSGEGVWFFLRDFLYLLGFVR